MPHFQIEYSKNIEDMIDMGELCEAIRVEATKLDAFPMPGVRVRAICAEYYAIADGNPKHGFIDISIRIREGRPNEVKKDAVQCIFGAAKAFLLPAMQSNSIALSAELRDINAELSPKFGTIRDHLEDST